VAAKSRRSARTRLARIDGVQAGQGEGDAVLAQVVADRHLAAEGVAAVGLMVIFAGSSLKAWISTGTSQPRPAQRVGDRALVAEVGQRHQHAVDLPRVLLEQVGALVRVGQRFHRCRTSWRPLAAA
jgi:hypothetical protein